MYTRPYGYDRNRKRIKWYHALITGMIPILIYALCFNAVTRVADGYTHDIRDVQQIAASEDPGDRETLEEIGIYLSEEELGESISDFMKGKSDTIMTVDPDDEMYEYYSVLNNEFTENDLKVMGSVRLLDNILAVLGALSLVWVIIMYIYHIRDSYETKSNLRKLFLISLPVQAALQIISIGSVASGHVRTFLLTKVIGVTFGEEDLLPQIFSGSLPLHMSLYILIGTVILTGIMTYVIWVTTKPRNTFNERRYFR